MRILVERDFETPKATPMPTPKTNPKPTPKLSRTAMNHEAATIRILSWLFPNISGVNFRLNRKVKQFRKSSTAQKYRLDRTGYCAPKFTLYFAQPWREQLVRMWTTVTCQLRHATAAEQCTATKLLISSKTNSYPVRNRAWYSIGMVRRSRD